MKIDFRCPKCRGTQVEEVLINVVHNSAVTDIESEGIYEYGETSNEGGDFEGYQCVNCGWRISVETQEELFSWLKENNMFQIGGETTKKGDELIF